MKRCLWTGNVNDSNDSATSGTIKKFRKHRRNNNQISASQPTKSQMDMDAVINSVAHSSDPEPSQSQSVDLNSSVPQQIVDLRSIFKLLSDQVSFLLSYIGVVESAPSTKIEENVANVIQLPVPTYSDIVQQSAPNLQQSFKQAIVAAVYVDQTKKAGQVANLVISGLPIHQLSSDKNQVTNMLATELNLHVDILKCKRLGKTVSGRIQPVLVMLRSVDEADEIMRNAKWLRNSNDMIVRENVHVNRHLTAAQS
jgi:hypothetical protein